MSAGQVNALVNLACIVVALGASFFPLWWLRTHNGDYKVGFRLIMPALAETSCTALLFGVLYVLLLIGLISEPELQRYARLALIPFLLSPLTLVLSLHYWQKDD